ncbi:MAG TPA: helicase-related protein, partial [Rhodospirillales bacterium]|nr:helicase-related protein [Rhodospirillales bacterium]
MLRLWPAAPAGIYSAGLNKRDLHAQILFAGIQSIHKRAYDIQRCDLVLIDEAHLIPRTSNTMYRRFLGDLAVINPTLKIIGFTATPYRLDSGLLHEGDGALFTDIAYEAGVAEMIAQGYLCEVVPKRTRTQLDTAGVGSRGGEFIAGQLEAAVDRAEVTASAVDEIVHHGAGRGSWLVFCAGVDHAHHVRDAIRSRGVPCDAILGETAPAERDRVIAAYKRGEIRCLTNANVLTTGFNAPGVDLIAMLRPTKSVGLYVQMIGRGTRLANGKENCLVLDFAGNVERHGPIDRIDGRKRAGDEEGHAPMKACPNCETILHAAVRVCPQCGHAFPPPEPDLAHSASTSAILSSQIDAQWATVTDVNYYRHEKPGGPPSLRVEYLCGFACHREWVCFEHTGFARQKSVHWWQKRLPGIPVPHSVEEALRHVDALPALARIRVRPQGRYTEITAYEFEPCSATSAAARPAASAGTMCTTPSHGYATSAPWPARTSAIGGGA